MSIIESAYSNEVEALTDPFFPPSLIYVSETTRIMRLDYGTLDNQGSGDVFFVRPGFENFGNIARDPATGDLFVAGLGDEVVYRIYDDGGSPAVEAWRTESDFVAGVTVVGNSLWWALGGIIRRAPLNDPGSAETVFSSGANVANTMAVGLSHIYLPNTSNLRRFNHDGTGGTTVATSSTGQIFSAAVDDENGMFYYGTNGGSVWRRTTELSESQSLFVNVADDHPSEQMGRVHDIIILPDIGEVMIGGWDATNAKAVFVYDMEANFLRRSGDLRPRGIAISYE